MTKLDAQGDVLGKGVGKQTTLKELMFKYYLGAAVMLIILAVGFYAVLEVVERKGNESDARLMANRLNADVEALLFRYIDKVEMLAADPNLLELIQYPESREVREKDLAKMIGAGDVMLFAPDEVRSLTGEYPLLSFSEISLIYEAEEGREARIDYHRLANGTIHFDVVRPIKKAGSIFGFVLARYDAGMFLVKTKALEIKGARFELYQELSDGGLERFVGWGDAARVNEDTKIKQSIANTNWQQSYWQTAKHWQLFGLGWRIVFTIVLVVVLLASLLLLWFYAIRVEASVVKCATVFYSYVYDRLNNRWLGKKYTSPLWEIEHVMEDLLSLDWEGVASRPRSVAPETGGDQATSSRQASAAAESERGRKEFEQNYIDILYQGKGSIEVDAEQDKPAAVSVPADSRPESAVKAQVPESSGSIFKAYDIRGVVGRTLNEDVALQIGKAFGTEAWEQGEQSIVVGRDARLSSEKLAAALIQGLKESGRDVIDIGQVPTPLLYFATHYLSARSGVMVTGSHNPPEYNGFKLVLRNSALSDQAIQKIYTRIQSGDYSRGDGSVSTQDLVFDYTARVAADSPSLRGLSVVLDCGNGVSGRIAPDLLRSLGVAVTELYCDIDGTFPNHHPDPSRPENMQDLGEAVIRHKADLGIAFDGDGDRIGVVDSQGRIIWPDRLMMLFAEDVITQTPGAKVVYDVKSSRHLRRKIEAHGGQAIMWKSGHSLMKAKMKETGALLGGEMSGHIFFQDRWYGFDDALYSAVRLLQIMMKAGKDKTSLFERLPDAVCTPELLVPVSEEKHASLMQSILAAAETALADAQVSTIDGVRAEYADGWGLVRVSNTMPNLTFRFEAETETAMERIKEVFRQMLMTVEPSLRLPF